MQYSIGQFAEKVGLSIYTLRYYEQEELLMPARKENGQRCYSEKDISWVEFIKRLKDTGMPIKEMRQYAALRAQGTSTMQLRKELLIEHRYVLQKRIELLREHLVALDDKIVFYQKELKLLCSAEK